MTRADSRITVVMLKWNRCAEVIGRDALVPQQSVRIILADGRDLGHAASRSKRAIGSALW